MITLLDNTVLSNFALVNRIDLLPIALGSQIATTPRVIDEYTSGVAKGILPDIKWDWLNIVNLDTEEETLFQEHLKRLNAGEAACLAVATQRKGRFLTDDRDARKLAAQLKIPISGILGILLRSVQLGVLKLSEANTILDQMVFKGYRSPVEKLDDL